MRGWIGVLAALAVAGAAHADDGLGPLKAGLTGLRATHGSNIDFDAGPELTPVKRDLRAWVEAQLPAPGADLNAAAARISKALDDAKLTCGDFNAPDYRCDTGPTAEENERGFVDAVQLQAFDHGRYVMLITGVGVRCGFDQSAYLYEQDAGRHWRLRMQVETDAYGKKTYAPQNFQTVAVSGGPAPLVTAASWVPSCSSNWKTLRTRLWRAKPGTVAPPALLDRLDTLFIGDYFVASATVTDADLWVKFTGASIDEGVLTRTRVLHYAVGARDRVRRVAPVALDPGDFVDEWVSQPWSAASKWLDATADRRRLARQHVRYGDGFLVDFDGSPQACRDPELWQVSVTDANDKPQYFQVRWRKPYDLAMVAVSSTPFAGCGHNQK